MVRGVRSMKRIKNPLIKRIPRELTGDWKKYLVVALFLILTIGFVSGMYVANGSMLQAAEDGITKYKREDGHFELNKKADEKLLDAIETGEKADVKQYYLDEARAELDKDFPDKFKEEFDKEFNIQFEEEFKSEFDSQFIVQIKNTLLASGMNDEMANAMLDAAVDQAKQNGSYNTAYTSAYEAAYADAYDNAYSEAYDKAYDEAWNKIQDEIDEKYADAEEKYELNDPDFKAQQVSVYENFYRNEEEDYNNDGEAEGTIRVFFETENVNKACIHEGRLPQAADEIAIDRMHADNVGVKTGDIITVGGKEFKIVGLIAYVNYATLHEKATDFMFDALKFDVAMVTREGFDSLGKKVHYNYAWIYDNKPQDDIETKSKSDDFMRALLTQTVVADNEIEDYIPAYANPAITFATDDMGSDEAMGGVLLDVLIVIIAFIFAITISNTIVKEASAIGTLRALGYTRGELVRHYLSMPLIVTFIGAVAGNILGYTVFKMVVVGMYYNSYSLPTYETVWNPTAFVKTTLIPVILMLVVNLVVIIKMLRNTPLQFLRHDLKKSRRKKTIRLPRWKFLNRFRMRIMLQNIPNYLVLFIGIFFIMVMLAMAVGMPNTLQYYKDNTEDLIFANYQYVLSSYEDEEGNPVVTDNPDAEMFDMTSLQRKSDSFTEEVSVYGIEDDSSYVDIPELAALEPAEVYITKSFSSKYDLEEGDTITIDEKYENKQYDFKVAGIYDRCQSIAIFMSIDNYGHTFELKDGQFSGYLSDTEITDIDEANIATVITIRDITKMCDQLDHSMGSYMTYFQYLCILLSIVLIYLLTKIIIEKNEKAISMTKILGYENREIAGLYLMSTTIMVVLIDIISVFLGERVLIYVWKAMMSTYAGWFDFYISLSGYVKMFAFVMIGYLIVMFFDFNRIKKIPMDQALKNVE